MSEIYRDNSSFYCSPGRLVNRLQRRVCFIFFFSYLLKFEFHPLTWEVKKIIYFTLTITPALTAKAQQHVTAHSSYCFPVTSALTTSLSSLVAHMDLFTQNSCYVYSRVTQTHSFSLKRVERPRGHLWIISSIWLPNSELGGKLVFGGSNPNPKLDWDCLCVRLNVDFFFFCLYLRLIVCKMCETDQISVS